MTNDARNLDHALKRRDSVVNPAGLRAKVIDGNAPIPLRPPELGKADFVKLMKKFERLHIPFEHAGGFYVVIDTKKYSLNVVSTQLPGEKYDDAKSRTIDDIVERHPDAIAIANGTFFAKAVNDVMQSLGYLRSNGKELPSSLPRVLPTKGVLAKQIAEMGSKPQQRSYVAFHNGEYYFHATDPGKADGHPPPGKYSTVIGGLLQNFSDSKTSIIGYNRREQVILLFSREDFDEDPKLVANGFDYSTEAVRSRIQASGFETLHLDGGGSVGLYVAGKTLVRATRHTMLINLAGNQTVTNYVVFEKK